VEAPGHLGLPAKHNVEFFPNMVENIKDPKARLEGVAVRMRRLAPNSSPSEARLNPDEPNL
jgi:hypothetical protein